MLHKLRGLGLIVRVFEAGHDVGGTWYWNRYPGARCDVESMEYSFSFDEDLEQEWSWTERYATQPEILSYARHVADRFDLRRDISFSTRVTSATFGEANGTWLVTTDKGEEVRAQYCVMATGCLSTVNRPDIPGLDGFAGPVYQTGLWPHEGVDFTGKAVCVIGTGSSAIQSIPVIARQAAQLTVFQRTANYVAPARNQPMSEAYEEHFKANYKDLRRKQLQGYFGALPSGEPRMVPSMSVGDDEREAAYEEGWERGGLGLLGSFPDLLFDRDGNETLAEFVRGKIRATVKNPATAELLCPDDHPVGSKRMCIDTGYFETFNRDNVTLVGLKAEPIERISSEGVVTAKQAYPCDALVLATGFDAMTGTLAKIAITGRGGRTLKDEWADGPVAYLGLMVAGFPNLFLVTGPGSPSVLSNMLVSIEQHVDWIAGCIEALRERGAGVIEADPAAQEDWLEHGAAVAAPTVYPDGKSWYTGANIAGKPRTFMAYIGGVPGYRKICDAVTAGDYAGFAIDGAEAAPLPDFMAVLRTPQPAEAAA
ncbi:cyclohexanone monooxygenase [Altererythrobacter salegens]|uniref:Cyclohexanone monooxygenase n=2 Tax=Croceibacterium salegens TaxID=1737568 RepID=A0A6I4SV37_9SPHN|nr:cyclohexanone monooxygenase [Croceibacterium salegens]